MKNMTTHEKYMRRALELAQHGKLHVSPNPMVGCVIVHNDRIIGEGYHAEYGKSHAEVNAVNSVEDVTLLKESSLYVTLEPCAHEGKTPPCVNMLLTSGIPEIYIAVQDPNLKVAGAGIRLLKDSACRINVGLLEKESVELNKRFFCFHQKKRPYIILKWAQTLDGYMDKNPPSCQNREDYWITNDVLRVKVHQWRAEEDAVFVGANTILHDNPQLNVRYCSGKNPLRITLIDKEIDHGFHFFDNTQPTIVFNFEKEAKTENTTFCKLDKQNPLESILQHLYDVNIQSVLIEGGRCTLQDFLDANLWDEARVLMGNKCFGNGLYAPQIPFSPVKIDNIDNDKILWYRNES
jgi:diaminohydroxyphosphoribosylaminopyrimidine deaminase/5-amino-6-(5-phosphoribosylamino)uracil reductase